MSSQRVTNVLYHYLNILAYPFVIVPLIHCTYPNVHIHIRTYICIKLQVTKSETRINFILQDINKQIIQLFSDTAEMNRESIITFMNKVVETDVNAQPSLFLLLLPCFISRIGKIPYN